MKAMGAKIREVDIRIDRITGKEQSYIVWYFSGCTREFLPHNVPERIKAFVRWAKVIKEYDNVRLYY